MAERRPKYQGLERVLGTGALFSTAYGNVGSSIYYALGLVTVYALGMTPAATVSGATPARMKASTAGIPSRSRASARDIALGGAGAALVDIYETPR